MFFMLQVVKFYWIEYLVKILEDELKSKKSDQAKDSAQNGENRIVSGSQHFARFENLWNAECVFI